MTKTRKRTITSPTELGYLVGFGQVMYEHFIDRRPIVELVEEMDDNMEKKTAQELGRHAATDVLQEQQVQNAVTQYSHEWNTNGDKCVKCGDSDWYADPHCSVK